MDANPAGAVASESGAYTAFVNEGGSLSVRSRAGLTRRIDAGVDRRLAFSPDERVLVYSKLGFVGETDLWRVVLDGGVPVQITDWRGSEDRPVVAPDGDQVAFVSGRSGVASWYVLDLPVNGEIVPVESTRQLTNLNLGPRRPGFARTGFTPPPNGLDYRWTGSGITWRAQGVLYTVTP
jgi:Tol biopolymer transport system component